MLVDVEVFVNARYGYDIRCEVVGEQGTLRLGEQVGRGLPRALRDRLPARARRLGLGRANGPSTWDGYAANAVADACIASLHDGERAAVELAERPALYG